MISFQFSKKTNSFGHNIIQHNPLFGGAADLVNSCYAVWIDPLQYFAVRFYKIKRGSQSKFPSKVPYSTPIWTDILDFNVILIK